MTRRRRGRRTTTGQDEPDAPSFEQWRVLYKAAMAFRDAAPWEWMWDEDVIGVKDPVSGEIDYCSVMGRLGQVMGLAVYQGTRGLMTFMDIVESQQEPGSDPNLLYNVRALVATFDDRKDMARRDLEVVKALGLKLRGRKAWPQFRDLTPGKYPWYITMDQARRLTNVFEQVLSVTLRFREDPRKLHPDGIGMDMFPVMSLGGGGCPKDTWGLDYQEPVPYDVAQDLEVLRIGFDPEAIELACGMDIDRDLEWEVDSRLLPEPVQERDERPEFPELVLVVDGKDPYVLFTEVVRFEDRFQSVLDGLLATIGRLGRRPGLIKVEEKGLHAVLAKFIEHGKLGIEVRLEDNLPRIEHFIENYSKYMSETGGDQGRAHRRSGDGAKGRRAGMGPRGH